jgi:hypothetical protein
MFYKLEIVTQVESLNYNWLANYKLTNPADQITTGYCQTQFINGFWYVIKDEITEKYITDYLEIIDELPNGWHEENKNFQVYMTQDQAIDFALSPYSEPMKKWREEKGIKLHRDNGVYFYLNFWEQGHRDIIEQFATITENMNY